jgi:hypothetical protein
LYEFLLLHSISVVSIQIKSHTIVKKIPAGPTILDFHLPWTVCEAAVATASATVGKVEIQTEILPEVLPQTRKCKSQQLWNRNPGGTTSTERWSLLSHLVSK